MIEFIQGSVNFPSLKDRGPDMRLATPCLFSGPVQSACVVLTGVDYGFTDDDHHIFRTTIQLNYDIDNDVVSVRATYGFRDNSGYWDDRYDGTFSFVVIADVATRPAQFSTRAMSYTSRTLLLSPQSKAIADKELAAG